MWQCVKIEHYGLNNEDTISGIKRIGFFPNGFRYGPKTRAVLV
jgi:hypothetical protein